MNSSLSGPTKKVMIDRVSLVRRLEVIPGTKSSGVPYEKLGLSGFECFSFKLSLSLRW